MPPGTATTKYRYEVESVGTCRYAGFAYDEAGEPVHETPHKRWPSEAGKLLRKWHKQQQEE